MTAQAFGERLLGEVEEENLAEVWYSSHAEEQINGR
jgi:hypothetical protein